LAGLRISTMNRRTFFDALAGGLLSAPLVGEAQQSAGKVYRLGILSPGRADNSSAPTISYLVSAALRETGYVEGRNLVVERRFADDKFDQLPRLARELIHLQPDVVVALGALAIQAAKEATATVPIVMVIAADPVARGLVSSLSRPGGNVTGVTLVAETVLAGKRLELIKETVPRAERIAVLATGGFLSSSAQLQEAQKAAQVLRLRLVVVEVQDGDYDRAFRAMVADRADAIFVMASVTLSRDRKQIAERAAKYHLPAIYDSREQVEAGGLMSYGGSAAGVARRVAGYIDKILKGTRAADLPVEEPTKFELVINLKTAKALGLTIPPSVLLRADEVIQ
jgi:putative ABC transport system substrate-binding protein